MKGVDLTPRVTLRTILGSSDDVAQQRRTKRLCTITKSDYDAELAERFRKIATLEDELEGMSDISASNSTLSKNAIDGTKFDSKAFVRKRNQLLIQLEVEQTEYCILKKDAPFYE